MDNDLGVAALTPKSSKRRTAAFLAVTAIVVGGFMVVKGLISARAGV